MTRMRKEAVVIDQIIELKKRGMGHRAISKCLGIARNTVRRALREQQSADGIKPMHRAEQDGSNGPGAPPDRAESADWRHGMNWEYLSSEQAKGVTFKILHKEACADTDISYWQFWNEFRKRTPKTPTVTMRLNHQPGQKTFFDFADGIDIVDLKTGEITKTQFICGVLPFSSYTYGEFVLSQKQPVLMVSIERAFHYFGGVTPYVTVDNLKSGVTRAHLYDPVVNPGFVEFANHWGFAVMPARPYSPRDKAANESAIGVIQRDFFNEVRDRTFYSLAELNKVFLEYLKKFNRQLMKDHGVSRLDRFENERSLLKSLAPTAYELCEWKECKVHPDCHVQIDHRFYSVPFAYVGRTVKARLTERMIEIFSEDREALAAHARLTGSIRVSTQDEHYPEKKVGLTRFEVRHAKAEASRIGPKTEALVNKLLDEEYPLRYLRRVQGILRLMQSAEVSREALEYACAHALTFQKLRYEYIKATAKFYHIHGNRPVSVAPVRSATEVHLHSQ